MTSLKKKHHFVSRSYLKNWGHDGKRVWTYRLLVSDKQVPHWSLKSIRSIGYREHLYTKVAHGQESDEIERWFDEEFEAPAAPAIKKAVLDQRMTSADWRHLIRFFAAQDARTPARFAESMERWRKELPGLIENSMQRSINRLEAARSAGTKLPVREPRKGDMPIKLHVEKNLNDGQAGIRSEVVVGRPLWLFQLQHVLSSTIEELYKHRWTIVKPSSGLAWPTSDNPAVRLNFYRDGTYDLKGGWGNPGTDLLLPLGPQHLLLAEVGRKRFERGTTLPSHTTRLIRKALAESADTLIFAEEPENGIERIRPRVVDPDAVKAEREAWRDWHDQQMQLENRVMGWREDSD